MPTMVVLAILGLVLAAYADTPPPFCTRCACTVNPATTLYDVICAKDIRSSIFDQTFWTDVNNDSYPYTTVAIHNNPILTLEMEFPNSTLTFLDLSNNSIVNITDDVFKNLQNMEILVLSHNNLEFLHPNTFHGLYLEGDFYPLRSLKILRLDYNRIHTLDADLFEHTDRIEKLTLSHNPLKVLDLNTVMAITSLVSLQKLELAYTGLVTLPDNFMHTPKNLEFLDLSGNAFIGIPETMAQTQKLKTLIFDKNPIVNLTKENGFPDIPTLTYLSLRLMPDLVCIGSGALSKLSNLEFLEISENMELTHIDDAALSDRRDGAEYETWPPIRSLLLQKNKLTHLNMHLLLRWNDLQKLDLTENPWTCECENQWFVDELMPIYLQIDENKAKSLRCAAPIEMDRFTFFDIYQKELGMRCLDIYGHRPERDGALLVGILAGILIAIPLILFVIYAYNRNWFGCFDSSAASFSRQFYRRTQSNDEYF